MAKYKNIGGTTVGFRSGAEEYTYPSGAEGSIYYNSSNGQFEFVGLGAGSWASGGNMNSARRFLWGAGTQTAGLAFGGYDGSDRGYTEEYDGSSWTESGDLSTARNSLGGSSGSSSTSGVAFAGITPPNSNATEEFTRTNFTIKSVTTS